MLQNKQPVIQSVFDRKLIAGDDAFFLRAIHELEGYRREIAGAGAATAEFRALTLNRDDRVSAIESVYAGMCAAENALRGVLTSFEELSQESVF